MLGRPMGSTINVDIWEERKVFGSRGQGLKDEMLGKNHCPVPASNGKSSNPIKIVKRDANSVRIKLAVGALPEKILTAFQSVLDEHLDEEAALNNCNAAVQHVGKVGEDVENFPSQGNQHGSALVDYLQEQENVLQQCVGLLESAETTRAALVYQLKEAIQDQESKLELIRTQLQVARGQIERARDMRKRLTSPLFPDLPTTSITQGMETTRGAEPIRLSVPPTSTPPQSSLNQPFISFAPLKTTEEENKKAAAAAVAAKLAASTSSAQMLTSVLSSLVAEEAAKHGSINSGRFTAGLSVFPSEKRPKLEKPPTVSDVSISDVTNTTYFSPLQQQVTNMPVAQSTCMQPMSQVKQIQSPFAAPPSLAPANPPASQFVHSNGMMVGVMPYGFGANTLPPPPPLPPHIAMGLARPAQSQQQPQAQLQSQQPATGGYYRPPGIGFYGQSQPSTPPVPRQ